MANLIHRSCTIEDCEAPHFGRGLCTKHYYRIVRSPKRPVRTAACAWCGESKPLGQMREPNVGRGKTPSTCHSCRTLHADKAWCNFHGKPHSRDRFTPRPKSMIGVYPSCIDAQSQIASTARALPDIECAACGATQDSWQFTGGRQKARTCRTCVESNPGKRWCLGCAAWVSHDRFSRTGVDGKFMTVRCNPCRSAHAHGVTVASILQRQGATRPECAACGSIDMLQIDHDHRCCAGANGCDKCVRGYLCHQCNTSEGLLVSSARARDLVAYMERHGL